MNSVLLCTSDGTITGTCDRATAHAYGLLHRAFSVFVFRNEVTELLIQQRHPDKLFGGLWANSCCSHVRQLSTMNDAMTQSEMIRQAEQRLVEELGFTTSLTIGSSFVYRAEDPQGKGIEHEYDTILIGHAEDDNIVITQDPREVAAWQWIGMKTLKNDIAAHPECYAPWLQKALTVQ